MTRHHAPHVPAPRTPAPPPRARTRTRPAGSTPRPARAHTAARPHPARARAHAARPHRRSNPPATRFLRRLHGEHAIGRRGPIPCVTATRGPVCADGAAWPLDGAVSPLAGVPPGGPMRHVRRHSRTHARGHGRDAWQRARRAPRAPVRAAQHPAQRSHHGKYAGTAGPMPVRCRSGATAGPMPVRCRSGADAGPMPVRRPGPMPARCRSGVTARCRSGATAGPMPVRCRSGATAGPMPVRRHCPMPVRRHSCRQRPEPRPDSLTRQHDDTGQRDRGAAPRVRDDDLARVGRVRGWHGPGSRRAAWPHRHG